MKMMLQIDEMLLLLAQTDWRVRGQRFETLH